MCHLCISNPSRDSIILKFKVATLHRQPTGNISALQRCVAPRQNPTTPTKAHHHDTKTHGRHPGIPSCAYKPWQRSDKGRSQGSVATCNESIPNRWRVPEPQDWSADHCFAPAKKQLHVKGANLVGPFGRRTGRYRLACCMFNRFQGTQRPTGVESQAKSGSLLRPRRNICWQGRGFDGTHFASVCSGWICSRFQDEDLCNFGTAALWTSRDINSRELAQDRLRLWSVHFRVHN